MGGIELFAIAIGLSMDAFAIAVGKGLCLRKMEYRYALIIGLFFGGFQALMPLIGYILGTRFAVYLASVDHWIIFTLLCLIGINMILESRKEEEKEICTVFNIKDIAILSIVTSIDALAVGITFAFLHANIVIGIAVIGIVTFILSFIGVIIGNMFGARFKSKAEAAGGIILILIGTKIFLEHLGVLNI